MEHLWATATLHVTQSIQGPTINQTTQELCKQSFLSFVAPSIEECSAWDWFNLSTVMFQLFLLLFFIHIFFF